MRKSENPLFVFSLFRPGILHGPFLKPFILDLLVMSTPHVIASSSGHPSPSVSNNGIVGGHYKVGKKIGEGSFGVVFEGWSWSS